MAIRFGLEDHQHFKVESQSRNGHKALTGVPGAMRSLGTSLNQTSLTPINPPRTLHLRTSEKRGVLHRMEVLSHLSHLQSPLPGQRGWSLVSNYPTILQPPAPGALVQHKAIQLSIRQSENNPLGVGASNAINGGEDNLALIWEMIVFVGVGVIVILL